MEKTVCLYLTMAVFATASFSSTAGGPPPLEGETQVAYEMATFDEITEIQSGGAELNAPGDNYRYTYLIDDEFINNPDYILKRAMKGIHIIDPDCSASSGDTKPEWGAITLDGKPKL